MTDLMTVFPVTHVEGYPGHLSASVQFQSTCPLFRESHKTRVWLRFLVLSLLSTSTCAAPRPAIFLHLQSCLGTENLKKAFEKSDAMLYAPSTNEVKENCKTMLLKCYILELVMVIDEERIEDKNAHCILDFNDLLDEINNKASVYTVDCPPCEGYSLRNITIFLERLDSLLQELNSMQT
ncbi:interleukin-15 [Spinachia spinachia]